MANRLNLTKEAIALTTGNNLQAYKRDGLILNTSPLEEYLNLTAINLLANQQVVFDLDKHGLDIIPEIILANFVSTVGDVTFKLDFFGEYSYELVISGANARLGYSLPKIAISHKLTKLIISSTQPCNFIQLNAKQVVVLDKLTQDFVL